MMTFGNTKQKAIHYEVVKSILMIFKAIQYRTIYILGQNELNDANILVVALTN